MKRWWLFSLAMAASAPIFVAPDVFAQVPDFDPRGRNRPKPKPQRPSNPKPGRPALGPPTNVPPSGGSLVERYTKIVLMQPGSPFPLQRLTQLYRDRDGNIKALLADFEKRAATAGSEQYASTVTLAGLYKIDGRADEAIRMYEKAKALRPGDTAALLSLARLYQDRGEIESARKLYAEALALQTSTADREQTIRTLMSLALDQKDWTGAKGYHDSLVKLQPTSLFVKGELGREFFSRNEFERAEGEFKTLVQASQGDNRTLAPALKELGKAQAKAHKNQEALATLKKALTVSGQEAAVRKEVYEVLAEIYRADQKLPVLIKELESENPNDLVRVALLGSLYEETGDIANALKQYEKAVKISPRQLDLRLKVIRLLQTRGELDRAIAEYDGLIRAAPNNPEFVFEQCETLMQRGDRVRAEKLLQQLEARAQTDEDVLSRLADFYSRIGQNDKSTKLLSKLAQMSTGDPSHIVELGDRYFQDNNRELALQTWKRILTLITPRAKALSAYGDVLLEHDQAAEALASFKEASQLEPSSLLYRKQIASAYERMRRHDEAEKTWDELLQKSKGVDKAIAREARAHLVTMWSLQKKLEAKTTLLQKEVTDGPSDPEKMRLLAEAYLHLRRPGEAETTLRTLLKGSPSDTDAYLALERVLVQQGKLADAVAVLEKMVEADPKRARELYQRMAQYSLQLYKDDDAIKYAARAVELNPDDAEGHRRLGEMYRSRQDIPHAIAEFRAAIAKNDRLFICYLELADLLFARGEIDEADRLYRRVARASPDDELLTRGARMSLQIHLGKNTLSVLEQDLLPLAIANTSKPIYRRILVEIYGTLTFGLVEESKQGGPLGEAARESLAKIGNRAIKPLLDALADTDANQQRIAIDVLRYVQNKNAGVPLYSFALGAGPVALRTRAMVACGALRDPAMTARFEKLLFPGGEYIPSDALAVAATWGLAELRSDPSAQKLLRSIADRASPELRAIAIVGLAESGRKDLAPQFERWLLAPEGGSLTHAAAAFALGSLGTSAHMPLLASAVQKEPLLTKQVATVSLARLFANAKSKDASLFRPVIESMMFMEPSSAAGTGRSIHAFRSTVAESLAFSLRPNATLPKLSFFGNDDSINVEHAFRSLSPRVSLKEREDALLYYQAELARAAELGLMTSSAGARFAIEAFGAGDGSFAPLFVATDSLSPGAKASRAMLEGLAPELAILTEHTDRTLRSQAVTLLGVLKNGASDAALVRSLDEKDEGILRSTLSATRSHAALPKAIVLLRTHPTWSIRVVAAETLARIGNKDPAAIAALRASVTSDKFALVRDRSLAMLAEMDLQAAQEIAPSVIRNDVEPRVVERARTILAKK